MTIVYDPLTYRTVVARPGEIPYKFWSVNKHVIDAASAGICTLHSGDEAPGDTTKLWLDLTLPENAVGAVKAYDGASWVALTPALFYSHIAGGAGGFVTDLEMATYVSGLIGVSLQAWGENLDQWSAIDPTAKEDTGVAATLDAAHLAAGDPHPQYLTAAEGAAAYQPLDADLTAWAAVNPSSYSTTAQIAAAYQPLDADLTSWAGVTRASGFDTFAATPSSVNLRALLSDEVGTGAAYFVGGALGTPSSATLTNATGLPTILAANEAADTTCFPAFFTAATGELGPKTNANLTFNASTGVLTSASSVLTTTDINGGTIDGAVIGGASAAAGTFTTATVGNTGLVVGASTPFSDAAGVLTLQNVDALDATTEATIEAAIDTLANLTSIQGRTVTLADAGANAIFGWDDVASAYENLTAAEATATLNAFTGDAGAGGLKGLVPAPIAGDATKFLKGDGTFASIPGGGDALTANPLSQFAATTSLQLKNTISDETGSGALVFATSPTLVTPALGTPASGVLTNCTGLPVSTGISGLGTGMTTLLADTYEEGSWTPVVSFATPGNLSVSYAIQTGEYVKIGSLVYIYMVLQFTPTHTTASGAVQITGMPFSNSDINAGTALGGHLSGLTYPSSRVFPVIRFYSSTAISVVAFASGFGSSAITTTQMPTATLQQFILTMCYRT